MADQTRPSPDGILISVIIPTRNRSGMLRDTLEALCAQTLAGGFEVIVVDNRSTDDTPSLIEEIRGKARFPLTFHVMAENRGPGPSRNMGAQMARGVILAFTDSDCRPRTDWLERGLASFSQDLAFLSGPVLYKPEQVGKQGFFARDGRELRSEHPTYPWSNVWYRRSVFLQMGGTDEKLCLRDFRHRVVDCGDTDLAWRIREAGEKHAFVPELVVYHELEVMSPMEWVWESFPMLVVPALIRLHPGLRKELLHWNLFFRRENLLLYLAGLGLLLGLATMRWEFLLLMLPYGAWLAHLAPGLSRNPVKLVAQLFLFALKHATMCSGLVYGSLRSRCLVL